ncbi:hypothetical protein [Saccharothrix xinjiangensis]|uniref:Membrane protein (TIGR02234 family) n=1 Tax=Saccharothrix xinjiangensis TaxID=204798 RepID=A0ABV9Y7Z9_9PSEU
MSRLAGVVALVVGAVLVVFGSLLPLYGVQQEELFGSGGPVSNGRVVTVGITGWELVREPDPEGLGDQGGPEPSYGYPLVLAALLAGAGAALQFRAPRQAVAGRLAAFTGAGLAAGVLWAVVETWSVLFGGPLPDEDVRTFVGSGGYLVGVAAALIAVGAVLSVEWPARAARPTGVAVHQVEDDDDTPPFGIAIPVVELGPVDDDRGHPTG